MSKINNGVKSLFNIAKNMVEGKNQHVSEDIKNKRQEICDSCPKLIQITKQCSECLCFTEFKTKFKQEQCPLDKWLKEE